MIDPFYAFLAFAALVVIETLAHQFALPAFFRFGLPVFFARRPLRGEISGEKLSSGLAGQVGAGQGNPGLRFPVLSPTEVAVQERLFENRARGRFLPVMHSLLRLKPGQVTLTGYLNLYVLAAKGYIVYRGLNDRGFLPVGILIAALFALSYAVQAGLSRQIIEAAGNMEN